jgi:hypothetical protein
VLLGMGPVLPGVLSGCSLLDPLHIDNCSTIPKGAIPEPNGIYVKRFQQVQSDKAEIDDFVIYKHEWYKGGTELGPYGTYHLGMILKRLPDVPFAVMLEESQDPGLNTARRMQVVTKLAAAGVPDADARVVLGFPEPKGLYGDETARIYYQMLISGGATGGYGGFGGGFGGFGGGGFGGGGFGGGGFGGGLPI